jgi:hypothetical protein
VACSILRSVHSHGERWVYIRSRTHARRHRRFRGAGTNENTMLYSCSFVAQKVFFVAATYEEHFGTRYKPSALRHPAAGETRALHADSTLQAVPSSHQPYGRITGQLVAQSVPEQRVSRARTSFRDLQWNAVNFRGLARQGVLADARLRTRWGRSSIAFRQNIFILVCLVPSTMALDGIMKRIGDRSPS